jgi:hypothetical protein
MEVEGGGHTADTNVTVDCKCTTEGVSVAYWFQMATELRNDKRIEIFS